MKTFLVALLLAPLLAGAQASAATSKLPPLFAYYNGTLNGKLSVHFYFFATNLSSLVHGVYHYGQRRQELSLLGAGYAADGKVLFPYAVSYNMLSDFISKDFVGRFGAAFSFADVQSFLRSASPLRRLMLSETVWPAPVVAPNSRRSHMRTSR